MTCELAIDMQAIKHKHIRYSAQTGCFLSRLSIMYLILTLTVDACLKDTHNVHCHGRLSLYSVKLVSQRL